MAATQFNSSSLSKSGALSPRFIWLPDSFPMSGRNIFAAFRRDFALETLPSVLLLHIFADTRYILEINGRFAGGGPSRFVTSHPEFDSIDIAPFLQHGENHILVTVNFYGASSFQTMPDGRPGFIAWGEGEGIDLSTPGGWFAAPLAEWRQDAPVFSFAQGPVEIRDTRTGSPENWFRPAVLPGESCPWGALAPYSGRPFDHAEILPAVIEVAGSLQSPGRIIACMTESTRPVLRKKSATRSPGFSAAAVWIHSQSERAISLYCFWTDLFLNGKPVEPANPEEASSLGNCQQVRLDLKQGWNLLACSFEILGEFWPCMLGFPEDPELELRGLPDFDCPFPIAVAAGVSSTRPPLPSPEDRCLPEGWELRDGKPPNLTPARICAWDRLATVACKNTPATLLPEMSPIEASAATWCLRFTGEFLGHPVVEVEAPEGAVLDVICDDWQTRDGTLALYRSNPFTDSADRFVLRGGRQQVALFHTRGGKFLQVTLRAPDGAPARLSLNKVFVRSRQTSGKSGASLRTSLRIFDWAFKAAATTLECSTSGAYSDCPWRERGMYIGDALVNMHQDMILFNDHRTARRMLHQFAQARREDGFLPACAPAWLRYSFTDYTLLWIVALRDFWTLTGDSATADELWPVVEGIWNSPAWSGHPSGLFNARGGELFIDWGVLPDERIGEGNAVLNLFRFEALRASSQLAAAIGREDSARRFHKEAGRLSDAIFETLWLEADGRLAPLIGGSTPALHANTLALAFGAGTESQRRRILAFLEPLLLRNFENGISRGQFSGHLELYFFHFLLPALAVHGRPDLAENLVSEHYGYLESLGDDTLPECFCRVSQAVGSRCHSWSGAPATYAGRHILGIQILEPGNPSRLLFKPSVATISSAAGSIAHPAGRIEVEWEKLPDGAFIAHWSAPEGVEIVPGVPVRPAGAAHSTTLADASF